jgi:hypothetical protein
VAAGLSEGQAGAQRGDEPLGAVFSSGTIPGPAQWHVFSAHVCASFYLAAQAFAFVKEGVGCKSLIISNKNKPRIGRVEFCALFPFL